MKMTIKIAIILIIVIATVGQANITYADAPALAGYGADGQHQALDELEGTSPATFDPSTYQNNSLHKSYVDKVGKVLAIIRGIGVVLSVVALMFIGFKMMIGSVEEKSDMKKAIPGYLIGIILVFATTALPSIIYEAANSIK